MLLADMGAEVIKVEEPGLGDYSRWMPPFSGNISAVFAALNRNKKSIIVNLKAKEGIRLCQSLAEKVDVVIESFRPGVMKRLSLDYETLKARNPGLIYCSITGYGQSGPYRDFAGHDINYLSYAGISDISGYDEQPPSLSGVQIADLGCGAQPAAIGILSALLSRQKTGEGCYLDISMLDNAVNWLSIHAASYFATGESPQRGKMALNGLYPSYGFYETKDGKYVALGALEPKFWQRFCKLVEREDLIHRVGPDKDADKMRPVRQELETLFKSKTRDEWVKMLKTQEICLAPVNSIEEAVNDPQVTARNLIQDIKNTEGKTLKQIAPGIRFGESTEPMHPPPGFGEHTRSVLEQFGYGEKDIEKLIADEIVKSS